MKKETDKEKDEVLRCVAETICLRTGKNNITNETNLRELGMDSLDLVELTMDLEWKFECDFPNDDLENLVTVADFVDLIMNFRNDCRNSQNQ